MADGIASADDPRLAPFARVGDHAWLRGAGLFVAEGRLIVQRIIDAGHPPLESVLVTPAAHRALAAHLDRSGGHVLVASQDVLDRITGFNFHRGCLALVRRPPPPPIDGWPGREGVLRGLDGVGNPDNVGGLFRTAASLGAAGILVGPATADPLYRKAVRTSMGAVLQLPWVTVDSWPAVLGALRARGYRVAALTPQRPATTLARFASHRHARLVLLLGAEGEGLTPGTLALADERVRIPVVPSVDSLNVTVAGGIALHAVLNAVAVNREP